MALIFALVLIMTTTLYLRGRDAVTQSTEKVDTSGRSRRALDAIAPLVASAVEIGGFEGLEVFDGTPLDLSDPCHLDITTRENFLDPAYDPAAPFDTLQPYYRFRLAFEPAVSELKLYQLSIVPAGIDSSVTPRLIARNVRGCRIEPVTVGSVRLTVEVQAERPNERRPDGITTTTFSTILVAPGTRT